MTNSESERTKISILTTITGAIGISISFIPLTFLTDPTAESIYKLQICVIIIAIIGLLPWYFFIKYVPERLEYIPPKSDSFINNIKCVFKNPSGRIYMIYDGVSVGIGNFLSTGLTFLTTYILGLNSEYQALHPEWNMWSIVPYTIPVVIGVIIGLKIQFTIPKKRDLKTAIMVGLIMQAIGFTLAFIGSLPPKGLSPDTLTLPGNLWLLSIGLGIAMGGIMTDIIYHNPMRAETIDYDEYITGERRESVYAGVGCLFSKPMISVALASFTAIIAFFGLSAPTSSDPVVKTSLYWHLGYSNALIGVGIATFLIPGLLAILGVIAWKFYPLDRKTMEKLRADLEIMHQEKRANRL